MSILEGLFFGSQVPFDEVNMDCTEYYQAGDNIDKYKENICAISRFGAAYT